MLSVLDRLDPWSIVWPRLQPFCRCMVQSLRNKREGDSSRKSTAASNMINTLYSSPSCEERILYHTHTLQCMTSCRQSQNSPNLNDCLDPGPPFLNDLCAILLRFKQHKFTFSSDIEKTFLHVHIDETDRDFTHFLWLSDPSATSRFVTFRFKVVLFGATCSPFMLNAALLPPTHPLVMLGQN